MHVIYAAPALVHALEASLRRRQHETEESIDKRLGLARGEIAFGMEKGVFDAVVVLSSPDQGFDDAINLISDWYPMINFEEEEGEGKEEK
jgi:guanylate kinase